jgi:hypothetical protein
MRRSERLAQIILGGVSLATLFKLVALVGLFVLPAGLDGPMTRTFERTASVTELTRELKPFADVFMAPGANVSAVTLAELGDLRPTPDKVSAVLAAEACYAPPEGQESELEARCTPERLARIEALVRWWALFALVATILLGGLGWWMNDTYRRRVLDSGRGLPRSADALRRVFEQAIRDARGVEGTPPSGTAAGRPSTMHDLVSGAYRFSAPASVVDPEEPGITFWLVSGLVIATSALVALSGGIIVAAIMVVFALVALMVLRIVFDRLQPEASAYRLEFERVVRAVSAEPSETAPSGDAHGGDAHGDDAQAGDPHAGDRPAERDEIEAIGRANLEVYEAFMRRALQSLADQNPTSTERRLVVSFGLGLVMVLVGNWLAAHVISLIHGWVFGLSDWSLSEGLAPPGQLWAALGLADGAQPLARPVLLGILVGLLALSFTLAIVADQRRSRRSRDRASAPLFAVAAIASVWALFVYAAAVLTWLAGLPETSPAGPAVLVRGGLVCEVPTTPITEGAGSGRAGLSATWAFGDDARAAFDLAGDTGACTLNDRMRYPQITVSELTRSPARAELAIVVGLASFEGAVEAEERLAARRAAALAGKHADLRVLSLVLGQHTGVSPAGALRPSDSAPQRKVLIYLAGRRGVPARRTPLSPAEEAELLRALRRDLEAQRGLDPGQYSTCVVQSGEAMAPDPALTAAFCGPDVASGRP